MYLRHAHTRRTTWLALFAGLFAAGAHALSLSVPKLLIDKAVAQKFPREKYGIRLEQPVLQLSQATQKIGLCGQWSSKLLQRSGDFCIDFQPQWRKESAEVRITRVQLLKLTAGDGNVLPAAITHTLNASLMQLLDGTPVYQVPGTVGQHLQSIEVQDSGLRLNF